MAKREIRGDFMRKEKRKVKSKALLALLMAVVLLVSSVPAYTLAAADVYYPLTVSGFNIDVVADTTNPQTLASQGCLEGGHSYYSSAVRSQGAYPSGSTITTTSGKKYTLRASTQNNSLQLHSGNQTGTLTLETPDIYSKLAVLVTGGGGQAQAKATVIYTDGTESSPTTITAYDWYSHHSSEVYGSLCRMRINISGYGRGSIDSGSYSGMYEGIISGLDTGKEVKAVRFSWASGSSSAYFNAFAISGVIGANDHIHDKISFKQWTSSDSLPTEAGNYVLASDVTISSTWEVPGGKTNLCLNGHGIKMTGSATVIQVGADSEFNLYECNTTTTHKFTVNSNSLATLNESSGTVTVNGGYITGGNTSGSGGAMVVGGTFNMYGGNIIGNIGGNGGAICTQANSTVRIKGGSIAYNYTGGGGGAVFCGRPAELYISSGSIHHNKAGAWGGGIYMPEGATCVVDVSGGSFTDNITAKNGGAIHVSRGATLKLSGNPYIAGNKTTGNAANNVNFAAGAFATIENSLDSSASIGVKSSSTTAVITSGLDANGSVSNFVSDNSAYEVYQNSDGEALIGVFSHNHDDIDFDKWDSTDSLPTEAGNYVLTNNVTISSVWNVPTGGEVNLCLNGKGIIRTNASDTTGSVINVGSGAKLNLYDCGTTERYYRITDPSANGAGLGTIISKAAYDNLSDKERGTFTGGYITGGKITGNADNQHLIGGGVNVNGGAFTMNGGTIFGNKVCINAGAVKVKGAGASFTMNGGALLANYNDCYGGAISVGDNNASRLCTVNINGGTIARNWSGRNAGALHVDGYGHTVNITGGNIVNNYTNGNYESAGRGGGAIMKDGANFSLSGNVVIKDNMRSGGIEDNLVFRNSNDNISLSSHLGDDAEVGVYTKLLTATTDHKVATDAKKDDLKHIHYDVSSEGSVVFCDGEKDWLCLDGKFIEISGTHHTHTANTIWASAIVPTASVEKDGDENAYTSLGDAVNNWTAGSTLKLLKDVTTSSTVNVPSGEHTLDLNGYGILMTGSGRVLTINKNVSLELNDSNPDSIHYITLSDYRGTAVSNSGETSVSNGNGVIKVTGGYLTGGFLNNSGSHDKCGAGVFNWGTFVMNGGSIVGNTMQNNSGAGIRNSGFFTMNDGTIAFNKASGNGGGVTTYVPGGGQGKMTMNGGVISDNYCGSYGGGIQLAGPFELTGGSVTRNTAGAGGSGIYYGGQGEKFKLSGNPVIKDNVNDNLYLNTDATFMISDSLTEGAEIGILMNKNAVFTVGWKDAMGNADPATYFIPDNSSYSVATVNGEAVLGNYVATVTKGENENLYNSLDSALSNWTDGSTLKLLKDVSTSSTITVPEGEYTLDLGGHGIRRTGTGCVIRVDAHSTLNLKDSNTSIEHKYKTANPAANGAGVATVDDTLTSGYKTFTGGYITGGYNNGGYNYGAGINIEGDGATLNMYGGTIIGNRLVATSTGGGGVCLQDWDRTGGFNMYGGSIIGNTSNYGGGVYVRCGTMVMYDGEISNNVASNNIGGAVLAFSEKSTFIMEGGTINGNTATHGGAIEASGGATASIFGGNITNNIASGKGGALTNQRVNEDTSTATFNISGAPVFSGNTAGGKASDVYLCNTAVLNVTDELTSTTPILVSRASGSGTFTSGWKDKMGEADPADYFTAEASNYQVRLIRNGEAYVGPPHTHNWGYAANGDTITATCSEYESGLCSLDKQTIKISAEGKTYDGSAVTATLTKSDDWKTDNGLTVPEIQYSGNTDAGTYTASITCATATASAEFTIDEASMADEVSDEGYTGDYDGKAHGISVTAPTGALVKYGTVQEGTYNLLNNPTYTNVGTYTVYYQVTKKNYITVTGSATVKINQIDAEVTIIGKNSTVDYDGEEHTITGYTATADTELYDVDNDFSFSGDATAVRTNAGTTNMGLAAEQFENTNPNFKTVTFNVTDGYQTVETVDAVITTAPENAQPIYNGSNLKLVTAGEVEGGTLWYALGKDPKNAPSDGYSTSIPTAKNTGSYYVWYKVIADENHNDLSPVCIKVVLAEDSWVSLKGTLYEDDGVTPASDATVTLIKGSEKVDYEITPTNGGYKFTVPAGVYNIVVEYKGHTETIMVNVADGMEKDIVMLEGNTDSLLTVNGDNFGAVVGGLNDEALSQRASSGVAADKKVSVSMTVESKTDKTAKFSNQFEELMTGRSFMFFDASLQKTVDTETTVINSTENVLEIAVPYEKINRRGINVYYSDGSGRKEFTSSSSKGAGTFFVDKENGYVNIYAKDFATFAIGYTPYYHVNSSISLGSFKGKMNVTIEGKNGEGTYKLENVSADAVSFDDVPKGNYEMTITWTDGAENTITMPFTVS